MSVINTPGRFGGSESMSAEIVSGLVPITDI
jgi:hypothetical protein